jgi:hypothetical protein
MTRYLTRNELIQRLRIICYNHEDPFTLDEWDRANVEQLRTIVTILGKSRIDVVDEMARVGTPEKRHCFLLEHLTQHLLRRLPAGSSHTNPLNPNQKITARQRTLVLQAYKRVMDRDPDDPQIFQNRSDMYEAAPQLGGYSFVLPPGVRITMRTNTNHMTHYCFDEGEHSSNVTYVQIAPLTTFAIPPQLEVVEEVNDVPMRYIVRRKRR